MMFLTSFCRTWRRVSNIDVASCGTMTRTSRCGFPVVGSKFLQLVVSVASACRLDKETTDKYPPDRSLGSYANLTSYLLDRDTGLENI